MERGLYDSLRVAEWFVANTDRESGASITHLKLQKLMYYAQAWTKVLLGKKLFDSRIEAWMHGPVVTEVYHRYKSHSYHELPIPDEAPDLDTNVEFVLSEILRVYGKYDAKYLEELTHQEDPWIEARNGLPLEARCENEIPLEKMEEFYRKMNEENS
ncbi:MULTISPECIES: type II toxin-antitoxin system antitoxin SocA domain-containing protein [unclassified Sutcliffiella]|uniref:Panacea domain-containing protein n=1 Tax=unclassified Sutcliffiella TaxID=2837532 RepID=UPI0030D114A9